MGVGLRRREREGGRERRFSNVKSMEINKAAG